MQRNALKSVTGCSASSETKTKCLYADIKRVRRDNDDTERNGRLNEVVIPELIEKMHEILLNDCKVYFNELADTLKVSKERIGFKLHDNLFVRMFGFPAWFLVAKYFLGILKLETFLFFVSRFKYGIGHRADCCRQNNSSGFRRLFASLYSHLRQQNFVYISTV